MAHTVSGALHEIQMSFPNSFVVTSQTFHDRVDVSVATDGTFTNTSGTTFPKGSFAGNDTLVLNGSGQVEDDELERAIGDIKSRIRFHDGNGHLKGAI